ncbi:thioredoxin-dependent thiol peroxidase [Paenibacillus sp. GCM10012307]|uniref:thioredoxin-dependent peroxiredoxin n=1 Tax=Paenibacillus roseus TaxID=2798579 RepID=A0A934MPS8_9BACL|nr:thioredoxin-dependent thiol peroxidase [Paenibacillus roseus]MBJ6362396.1 thioredoxin-dependent thiol peroxidase [Paenibacillus roseus]
MEQVLKVGEPVPEITLPAANGEQVSLSDFRGKKVILYFYPKDNTPTCTEQSCGFRDAYGDIEDSGAVVIGVSTDDVKSHKKFIEKYELPFVLLADTEHEACEAYGVWQLKKMYGKEYMGIVRSTFLIDEEGRLLREWRKVRLKGHLEQVLESLKG